MLKWEILHILKLKNWTVSDRLTLRKFGARGQVDGQLSSYCYTCVFVVSATQVSVNVHDIYLLISPNWRHKQQEHYGLFEKELYVDGPKYAVSLGILLAPFSTSCFNFRFRHHLDIYFQKEWYKINVFLNST
jgi:hypothetical protein